jgi:pimeloyl-ACP methyl ester carboxylesterase
VPETNILILAAVAAGILLGAVAVLGALGRRRRAARSGRLAGSPAYAPPGDRIELRLSSGTLAARSWGSGGDLVLCLPGLAATSGTFAAVAPVLAERHRVVALDLRGRGRSETTPLGTYGWRAHARDALEAATMLDAERFTVIGHSMGAYVAMQAAALAPGRVAAIVLIDSAGMPDPLAAARLLLSVRGLTAKRDSAAEHTRALRDAGVVQPWSDVWEQALLDDLETSPDGVRRRTSRAAVMEDATHAMTRRPRDLWDGLDMPVLLVRATRPISRTAGFVVPARERDAMSAHVPGLRVVEVAANHLGILTHPATVAAILDFMTARDVRAGPTPVELDAARAADATTTEGAAEPAGRPLAHEERADG